MGLFSNSNRMTTCRQSYCHRYSLSNQCLLHHTQPSYSVTRSNKVHNLLMVPKQPPWPSRGKYETLQLWIRLGYYMFYYFYSNEFIRSLFGQVMEHMPAISPYSVTFPMPVMWQHKEWHKLRLHVVTRLEFANTEQVLFWHVVLSVISAAVCLLMHLRPNRC